MSFGKKGIQVIESFLFGFDEPAKSISEKYP